MNSRVAASGLATCFAIAALLSTPLLEVRGETATTVAYAEPAPAVSLVAGVPAEALPDEGRCRIWYDELSADAQPAQMECEHAHWVARSWGGRVVSHEAELAAYEGRNDFTGVTEADLPRAGYCRVWTDDGAQTEDSDCRTARRVAAANGGRVLYMPL